MKKHIRWLVSEIETWVHDGIIDDTQAEEIRERYSTPEQTGNWGRVVFAAFGAILIGLGVILLFAYNWDKMHKFAKLGVVFIALIATHGAALVVKRTAARETLHVLGTMFFGVGIWLVAQVYHLNEHYPTAFLVWGLGALSLAWVLPSLPQALMAVFLLVLWNGFETYGFHAPNHATPFLILIGVLPLALVLSSRVLLSVGLVAFLLTLIVNLQSAHVHVVIPVFLSLAATLAAIGLIVKRSGFESDIASPFFFFGNSLYVILVYILTFRGVREAFMFLPRAQTPGIWFYSSLSVAAVLWVAAFWRLRDIRERIGDDFHWDILAIPLALVIYTLQYFGILTLQDTIATAPYNILILFSAIMLMRRGFRTLHLRSALMGSILLSALAIARYIDLFQSILARAAVFLLIGGMMLGIGIFFVRARKEQREEEA
jgi:uncharacterized membrane protein